MGNLVSDILEESRVYLLEDINSFYTKVFEILNEKQEYFKISVSLSGPNNHLTEIKESNKNNLVKFDEMLKKQNKIEGNEINLIIMDRLIWIFGEEVNKSGILSEWFEEFFGKSILPVEITSKKLVSYLFNENFSDNLLEIFIDGEDIYDFESDLLLGSRLNKTIEYNNIMRTNGVHFIYLKLQPKGCNHTLKLRYPNMIEFSNKMKETDLNFVLIGLSKIIETVFLEKKG
ncbi:hypothetical protein P4256_20765 [Bacillus wiedmannii]|uniref:hypothetical protein n=1 Tax=Bacillus wiedmannii TaxID=1890302 RepID=UPI002E1CE21A|nr:hypothetical protein [Bacillus wiedmannii]